MVDALTELQACPLDRMWIAGHYGAPVAPEHPGIRLERTTPVALVQLSLFPGQEKAALSALKKASIKAFPVTGHSELSAKLSIYALGSGRYLIESSSMDLQDKLSKAISSEIGSVTDLSSARTVLTISGPDVETVLAKGIAIDFHQHTFPVGTVAQTSVHHMPVMLIRLTDDQFRLFSFSTYAASTLHWLETACHAHGFERI